MDKETNSTPGEEASNLRSLEAPIYSARASARVLSIVVDEVLASHDLASVSIDGVVQLTLDEITAEALYHAVGSVTRHTQDAVEAYARIAPKA